jgi:hypothetical protein
MAFVGVNTLVDAESKDQMGDSNSDTGLCSHFKPVIRWHEAEILPSALEQLWSRRTRQLSAMPSVLTH